MIYEVRLNGESITRTQWQPMAEAAWHRATRDQTAGGIVQLLIDGTVAATHRVVGGRGGQWPGQASGLRDVAKAIIQLLRTDNWSTKEIAEAMTAYGLPTARARVDAIKGSAGRSADVSHAEIITLIYAVIKEYKQATEDMDKAQ